MNENDPAALRLRERFASPPGGAAAAGDCADPDRIWRAARGELPWSEAEALVVHAASCAACTVAWRMGREQARAEGLPAISSAKERGGPSWRWVRYGAAAAVVVVAAGLVVQRWPQREAPGPALRSTAGSVIHSSVPDASELPRSAFRLRWTPGPPGTRYSIQVTDETLSPIAEAAGFDAPEFLVPEAALGRLAPGSGVLWQVKAVFPDGVRVTSDTFLARVGPSQGR